MISGNKNIIFVETNAINISVKFQLHLRYGSRENDFFNIFSQIQRFEQNLYVR